MAEWRCESKQRKKGVITGYTLVMDDNSERCVLSAAELKERMQNGFKVSNLRYTADGRIIRCAAERSSDKGGAVNSTAHGKAAKPVSGRSGAATTTTRKLVGKLQGGDYKKAAFEAMYKPLTRYSPSFARVRSLGALFAAAFRRNSETCYNFANLWMRTQTEKQELALNLYSVGASDGAEIPAPIQRLMQIADDAAVESPISVYDDVKTEEVMRWVGEFYAYLGVVFMISNAQIIKLLPVVLACKWAKDYKGVAFSQAALHFAKEKSVVISGSTPKGVKVWRASRTFLPWESIGIKTTKFLDRYGVPAGTEYPTLERFVAMGMYSAARKRKLRRPDLSAGRAPYDVVRERYAELNSYVNTTEYENMLVTGVKALLVNTADDYVRDMLRNTGNKMILFMDEKHPWSTCSESYNPALWRGKNMLGRALMEGRDFLDSEGFRGLRDNG